MKKQPESQNDDTSPGRPAPSKLWMRLAAAVLSPVIVLILMEIGLGLAGYGRPKSLFIKWKAPGETVYLANEHYCEHFVPKDLARAPEPSILHAKNASTMRIFVLGGSAAFGDPDPAFGFCRQLEWLLNEHSAERSFEVVNVAVTSMNSHVARRIAQDCAAQRPDAFIVFMGNNEVVGPYGPPTLPASLYASGAFINACITAKKETRLGQLVSNVGQALRTRGEPAKEWLGMEAFLTHQIARDDDRLKDCYRHFGANIRDIVKTAARAGARTILCTVPTNLRSCAPFGSMHQASLTAEQTAAWEVFFREGRRLEATGDFLGAVAQYEKAGAIDPDYANLAFCMGTCLDALGKSEEAQARFIEARDLDTLRFRADSSINATIRKEAKAQADRGVTLLDLEGMLQQRAGDGVLLDHVHLNFQGNFLAALAAMQTLRGALPEAGLRVPEKSEDELLDLCRRRLLYDTKEQYRLTMVMYRRKTLPPFAGQINHLMDITRLGGRLITLRQAVKGRPDSEEAYLEALAQAPADAYLLARYGDFLTQTGRVGDATRAYQTVLGTQPYVMPLRLALARTLAYGGMKDQAVTVLTSRQSPSRYRRQDALLMLGTYYVTHGKIPEAQAVYEELNAIDPDNIDVLVNLAAAASHRGDLEAMKRHLDRAIKINPQSVQAMTNMGNYYAKMDMPAEAQKWFAKAVQADPHNHLTQIGMGIQSIRAGEIKKGVEHVLRAISLKPDLIEGYQLLETVYTELGQKDKARECATMRNLFQP